ncbi:MAG: DNA-packaging protein [Eubacteriales bacterium]
MALLDDVKLALRASGTELDSEMTDLISAASADLTLAGILPAKISTPDALIKRAITVYCKANFGWDNTEAERLQQSYELLKAHLASSTEYIEEAVT